MYYTVYLSNFLAKRKHCLHIEELRFPRGPVRWKRGTIPLYRGVEEVFRSITFK